MQDSHAIAALGLRPATLFEGFPYLVTPGRAGGAVSAWARVVKCLALDREDDDGRRR